MWQKYMPRPYRHVVAWNEEEEQFQERLRRPPLCQTPLSQVLKSRLRELLSRMPRHRGLALRLVELQQQQPPGLNDPWFSKSAAADGPLDLHSLRVVHATGSATSLQGTDKLLSTTDGADAESMVTETSQEGREQKPTEQVATNQRAGQPDIFGPHAYAASERSSFTALPCFTQTLAELSRYSTLKELAVDEQLHRHYRQEQELQLLAWEVSRWQGGEGRRSRRRPLSVDQLRQLVPALTLNDCQITKVDRGLRRLSRLQLLSLAGNWLHRLPGRRLPSALRSLELFANRLQDLCSLADDPPSWLLHLGLARNQLSDSSNLHLLGDCFKQLRTLDLGDNDICVLEDVLNTLRDLKHLRGLRLEGNPCAMCMVYREAILLDVPSLHFLDDIELWNMDRYVPEEVELRPHLSKGVLLFFCYRLMGLPQPRPMVVSGKKVIQTYHVEVELPLMDPELWKDGPTPPPTPPPERPPSPPPAAGKKADAGAKGTKKDGKGRKSAAQSEDEAETGPPPPDPLDGVEEEPVVCSSAWFRTPDLPWAKLLAYPEPLELKAPGEDLSTLRDTFRSEVRVKVVLQQALPPEKPKRAKPGKKDAPEEPPEEPRETVVGRVVMAQFRLRLRPPRWDEAAVDFEWALGEAGDRPAYAQPAAEPLLDIVYRDKKEKPKPGASEPVAEPRPVPERLTCHVGLGVRRLLPSRPHVPGYEAEALGLSHTWSLE